MATIARPLMTRRYGTENIATQYESGGQRPVKEVLKDLNVALFKTVPRYSDYDQVEWDTYVERELAEGCRWGAPLVEYGFKPNAIQEDKNKFLWPSEQDLVYLMVFCVTGSNEGYYIHVDALIRVGERNGYRERKQERINLGLAKVLTTHEWALTLTSNAAKLLGA